VGKETIRLTVGQALVRWLQAQWSERDDVRRRAIPATFGIFGHGNALGLGQALAQEGGELRLYQPKNEQAMVHAAIGFAKASRRMQTFACTASIGPGATNMLTGAATATVNRLPVLLLPADTFASRRQGTVLQQLEHPTERDATVNDAFRPLSRFFDRVSRPEQLLDTLPAAMRVLLDPVNTGAVTVAIHQDVLGEGADFPLGFFEPRTWTVARQPPAAEELRRATALLRSCERPLVIAGGGVRYSVAEHALAAFAEALGAPVAETSAGKGTGVEGPLAVGGIGVNGTAAAQRLAAEADLVIAVGTRLTDFTTASRSLFQHLEVRFLAINVAGEDAVKLGATPVVADARLALEALTPPTPLERNAYRAEVRQLMRGWSSTLAAAVSSSANGALTRMGVYRELNRAARPGDWLVAAAGWAPGDLLKTWQTTEGGLVHLEFGFSCMGHELPAALGIRMQHGDRGEIFVVIGDGTYLMGASELATAVQEQLKVTVVVLDNAGYGSIDTLARESVGVSVGNRFRTRAGERLMVDFVANAGSFGCLSVRADDPAALREALGRAREHLGPVVIVCETDPDEAPPPSGAFWDLGVPEPMSDGGRRQELQRFYG